MYALLFINENLLDDIVDRDEITTEGCNMWILLCLFFGFFFSEKVRGHLSESDQAYSNTCVRPLCKQVWLLMQGLWVQSPARPHTFVEIDCEIFSTVILPLLVDSYKRKNVLTTKSKLAQEKVVRLTDHLNMTIVVDWDVKSRTTSVTSDYPFSMWSN